MKFLNLPLSSLMVCIALIGCGKNQFKDTQEIQRDKMAPEIKASWSSKCEGNQIHHLKFDEKRLNVERVRYYDPECTERERTTRYSGTYELAHTFKEGIQNSIIFHLDNEILVTLHSDFDIDAQNNVLTKIQNEKEMEIKGSEWSPQQKKNTIRENMKIRAGKEITQWHRDQEKKLSRLQAEKLDAYGLNVQPPIEYGSRTPTKYEVDNGFLQLYGGKDFGRVFSKNAPN